MVKNSKIGFNEMDTRIHGRINLFLHIRFHGTEILDVPNIKYYNEIVDIRVKNGSRYLFNVIKRDFQW